MSLADVKKDKYFSEVFFFTLLHDDMNNFVQKKEQANLTLKSWLLKENEII